jgi:ATP-dependent protease ClpP protease subunit
MTMNLDIRAQGGGTELRIYGDIGEHWDAELSLDARTIAARLDALQGDLAVRINSFGGSVADGLAIYNALRRHNGRVTTHIDGIAYSIASLIAMAGAEIRMAGNAILMIHAPWGMAIGNAPEMREMADILDKHAEAMVASYARPGGPSAETIRQWLTDGEDHYFLAGEAADLGLVDYIDDAIPELDIAASLRGQSRFTLPAASRRSHSENAIMAEKPTPGASDVTPDFLASHSKTVQAATAAGIKAEAERRRAVASVFGSMYTADPLDPVTALYDACMEDTTCNETETQRRVLAYLRDAAARPVVHPVHYSAEPQYAAPPDASRHLGGSMQVTRDQADKRASGLLAALRVKAGIEQDRAKIDQERRGEFLSLTLIDIMAQELRASGRPINGSREDIARRYLQTMPVLAAGPSHGTDHLPAVLGNIANLSAMQGWEASEETWSQWTQSGTLTNYQTHTRANIALLDKLTKMLEHQEWEYGDMADVKQRITGYFYGLKYSLSIQSIVNDDLGELARTMNGWGEAAGATVGDAVYALLTTAGSGGLGQVMDEDSKVLFHADHTNYVASGSGGVPTEALLNTARAAMVAKNDPNGRKVAVRPRFILHGPALFSTVRKVLNSEALTSMSVDGSTGATVVQGSSNSVQAMNLEPIEEYRFTSNQWLLAAARRTVEVAGVGGPVSPRAEQSMVSNIPGLTYELSMPFGVAALDYRGLYYNHGA